MNAFPEGVHPESPRRVPPDTQDNSRPCPPPVNLAGGGPAAVQARHMLRLLCIDDDEQILETLGVCLGHLGHQVKAASGGKRGIEEFCTAILKSEPYDAVITDMSMPEVNGYEVARTIKAESPKTPIVLLSGAASTPKEAGVPPASVDAVLNKPVSLKQLNDLLLRMTAPV
jgi:CheY-like chemotaxis protein